MWNFFFDLLDSIKKVPALEDVQGQSGFKAVLNRDFRIFRAFPTWKIENELFYHYRVNYLLDPIHQRICSVTLRMF